ncbi:MAG: Hpt domain-containing protein [Luteibaculum sp.]
MGLDLTNANEIGGNDPEFIRELLTVYVKRFPEYHSALVVAIKDQDLKEMASRIHRVKSAVSVLGFKKFCSELKIAEDYCLSPEANLVKAISLSNNMLATFEASLAEVEQYLKTGSAS